MTQITYIGAFLLLVAMRKPKVIFFVDLTKHTDFLTKRPKKIGSNLQIILSASGKKNCFQTHIMHLFWA